MTVQKLEELINAGEGEKLDYKEQLLLDTETKKKEFDYEKENYIFIIIYGYDKWSTVYCSAGACFRRWGGTGYM